MHGRLAVKHVVLESVRGREPATHIVMPSRPAIYRILDPAIKAIVQLNSLHGLHGRCAICHAEMAVEQDQELAVLTVQISVQATPCKLNPATMEHVGIFPRFFLQFGKIHILKYLRYTTLHVVHFAN